MSNYCPKCKQELVNRPAYRVSGGGTPRDRFFCTNAACELYERRIPEHGPIVHPGEPTRIIQRGGISQGEGNLKLVCEGLQRKLPERFGVYIHDPDKEKEKEVGADLIVYCKKCGVKKGRVEKKLEVQVTRAVDHDFAKRSGGGDNNVTENISSTEKLVGLIKKAVADKSQPKKTPPKIRGKRVLAVDATADVMWALPIPIDQILPDDAGWFSVVLLFDNFGGFVINGKKMEDWCQCQSGS